MKKFIFTAVGFILLTGALPAVLLLWYVLPSGAYPAVLVGIPALPLLWAGFTCLNKAGLPVDDWILNRPWAVGGFVSLLALIALYCAAVLGIL